MSMYNKFPYVNGDAWKISGEDRAKHDAQFFNLKPVSGFITGEQAREFFMHSGLPTSVLGQIWGLADTNNDGKMDKKEFSIAMHLIRKKLQGYELPKTLPLSLKADPAHVVQPFATVPVQPGMMGFCMSPPGIVPNVSMSMGPMMPLVANGFPPIGGTSSGYMGVPVMPLGSGVMPNSKSTGSLAIPHSSKLKYTQIFNTNDRNKRGTLTGVEASSILMLTDVPPQILAEIWNLSDIDMDGELDCDEFCIAMHLTDVVKMGRSLPPKLPPELLPKAKSSSIGSGAVVSMIAPQMELKVSFDELLGSIGMPTPVHKTDAKNGDIKLEDISQVTFEDKRKENFDKGQAELERRRLQLQEQLRKEEEARIEKERQEQDKREKIRQEQESKKQHELERQLERQREIERQKEEQRQKIMEQRESARRELERQRQIEWACQRKEHLIVEKTRKYEELMALKSKSSNLKCEVESLKEKKSELCSKLSKVKHALQDITVHIEAVRSSFNHKNNHIDRLQSEIKELNQKLKEQKSQKAALALTVQTSSQADSITETQWTLMHNVELKKTSLQKLTKDLELLKINISERLAGIESQSIQFEELNSIHNKLLAESIKTEQKQADTLKQEDQERMESNKQEPIRKYLQAKLLKSNGTKKQPMEAKEQTENNWLAFGNETKALVPVSINNWTPVFDAQPSANSSTAIWGSKSSDNANVDEWSVKYSIHTTPAAEKSNCKLTGLKKQYKALYHFEARNQDELSLSPGDIVMVFEDQIGAEPGWRGGELNGKCGWFPEAYVDKIDDVYSHSTFGGSLDNSRSISSSDNSSFMAVMPVNFLAVSPTPGQGKVVPEGVQAQALSSWKAQKCNHLSFNKGDIITINEQQDIWWSGEISGKYGWFPKTCVKLVSGPNAAGTAISTLLPPVVISDSQALTGISDILSGKPADQPTEDQYIGLYAYQSNEPGDLTFNQGDIVTVTKADGDWWTGTIANRSGIFPANYVKKYVGLANKIATPSLELMQDASAFNKPEIAAVIAAYVATGKEQLSLSPGQLIHVIKKSPSGWWEGELQARGQTRKIGWFPADYVKLYAGSSRNTPDNMFILGDRASPAISLTSTDSIGTATPTSMSLHPAAKISHDHVTTLYPYNAQHADELTFPKDAVITVIKKDDPSWWQGEYNGEIGMFPSNYVQSAILPDTNSLWSADPQVLAMTSAQESNRQTYIHELINTEESYIQDMSIVLEAFYKPLKVTGALKEEELNSIFVNWEELIVCNTKLQKALRVRKKMCGVGKVINSIGDILTENIPHLTPYIRFCSCQLNAAALLQSLTENNSHFIEIHKKCVQNPKTKGMPLSSFLLKPMQRITKYPLIVEKILKYTPEGHPDHNHLQEALESCQELCSQVNEGVREKENSDRLEWIQQNVHCEGLPEKITFNSRTNCLGPRKLLHTGVVFKAKSNKELGAFLFNDFLLLSTSNRPLNYSIHSLFDLTGQVQYKMYKTPIFLNEVMIKKQEDTDTFTINHIDRVFNLKCHSQTERNTWVRNLEKASRSYLETERKKMEKAISSRLTPGMGRLLVVILEGKDLQASDANGKSDPYCEVSMGAQEHKTKVISSTLNPKWNANMQFIIRDVNMDTLCITVFDRDLFSPNDFLGRTEIQVKDIMRETSEHERQPIVKSLLLHEVSTGEVVVKLDLHIFDQL